MGGISAGIVAGVFMSLSHTVNRYFFGELFFNVWAFVCLQAIGGGIILVLIAGWRNLAAETFKNPVTWILSAIKLLDNLFFGLALVHLSASEAINAMNLSKISTLLAAWLLMKRSIHMKQLPPLSLIVLPAIYVAFEQPEGFLSPGILWILATCLCLTIELLIAENHPVFNKATNVKHRLGYTGATMAANGIIFLLLMVLVLSLSDLNIAYIDDLTTNLPSVSDIFQPLFIFLAVLTGVALRAMTYIFRYFSILKIKAEKYSILSTCQLFMIFVFESIAIYFGWLERTEFSWLYLWFAIMGAIGAVWYFRVKTA